MEQEQIQQQKQKQKTEETETDPTTTTTTTLDVEILSSPRIKILPFAKAIPTSIVQGWDEPEIKHKESISSLIGNTGIVGTITILQKQILIWVGWGHVEQQTKNKTKNDDDESNSIFLGTGKPSMGPMVLAMPRTNYRGAFGSGTANSTTTTTTSSNNTTSVGSIEPSCSNLIGSNNSDDIMLGTQMASRLSVKSKKAIFVSCQLASSLLGSMRGGAAASPMDGLGGRGQQDGSGGDMGIMNDWMIGTIDPETIAHRAAAIAEKEIWSILQSEEENLKK